LLIRGLKPDSALACIEVLNGKQTVEQAAKLAN
jgi:hypothetical protein